MKYIHGFLSSRLKEVGISHDQSLVIRYLLNFINSNKMEKILVNGEFYYWVKYEKVVTDLDILGIKKQAISDMLCYDLGVKPNDWEERLNSMSVSTRKKREKAKFLGIFKRYTKKDAEGTRSYFAPTDLLYSLLPDITDNDDDMKPNKKASTVPPVKAEDLKNNDFNNIIPQNNSNDTKKEEDLESINLIKESCINVKKADLIKYKDEFTDINRFKEAIAICESRNSHGIKALRLAYKCGDSKKVSSQYMVKGYVGFEGKVVDADTLSNDDIQYLADLKNGTNFTGKNSRF